MIPVAFIDRQEQAIVANATTVLVSFVSRCTITFFFLAVSLTRLRTENEDHHCVWLNNCIGRRNYRSFFIFINTASILCLYTLAFSIIHVISLYLDGSPEPSFLSAIQQAPVSFALVILCFVLLWSVGGLTGYHCYLALSGVTTHEQVS